jgi:AcrR family transcriptional regulator
MAAKRAGAAAGTQAGLSRDRVLRAAVAIADERGIAALTMRSLAESLGVEAMSLYHHVANKEAVLDGLVDVVMAEIEDAVADLDAPEDDWKAAMRRRVLTAREVLLRHPWAPSVFETRTGTSRAVARYFDGVLALMRRGGFSYELGHRALHALGSRALGFSQELFTPDSVEASEEAVAAMAEQVPHLAAMVADASHGGAVLGWCDYQAEFEFGLDLILDGLERLRAAG